MDTPPHSGLITPSQFGTVMPQSVGASMSLEPVVTPGNRHWRLEVGSKSEMVLLSALLVAAAALYPLSHIGFRDGLQALLRNFDIAREQYQRQAGTHWYDLELTATENLTLQAHSRWSGCGKTA